MIQLKYKTGSLESIPLNNNKLTDGNSAINSIQNTNKNLLVLKSISLSNEDLQSNKPTI